MEDAQRVLCIQLGFESLERNKTGQQIPATGGPVGMDLGAFGPVHPTCRIE